MSSQKWFWSRVSNYTMGENCIQCLSLNGKQVGLLHAPHVAFVFAPCVARPDSPCLKPAQDTSFCHLSVFQQRQEEEDSLSSPEITCDTKDDLQKLEAWIQERKQLRSQLKSFGDVEKWLSHKPTFTKLEERVRKRITAARVDQRARSKSVETDRPDVSIPGVVPLLGLLYFISCGRATASASACKSAARHCFIPATSASAGRVILDNGDLRVFSNSFSVFTTTKEPDPEEG